MSAHFLSRWRSRDTGHRVWPKALLWALAWGCAAAVLSVTALGERLEQQVGLWISFNLRGPVAAPDEVVLIAMRRDTGQRVSLPATRASSAPCDDLRVDAPDPRRRPLGDVPARWGRCHHVALLKRLAFARPSVVALDVTFRPRSDLDAGEDRELAAAMRALGNVVVVEPLARAEAPDGNVVINGPVPISPEIAAAAAGRAVMSLPNLQDERCDKFWTFLRGNFAAPTLPALALQAHSLEATPQLVDLMHRLFPEAAQDLPGSADELRRDGALHLQMLRMRAISRLFSGRLEALSHERLDPRVRRLVALYAGADDRYLNYYGAGAIRTLSIAEVLATAHSAQSPDPFGLRGKIVFVGFADDVRWELLDKFSTVYSWGGHQWSGVQIAATALGNLLDGSGLRPTPRWGRALIAFVAGGGGALLCYTIPTLLGAAAACLALLGYLAATLLLFRHLNVWAPTFLPIGIAAPAGFAVGFVRKSIDIRGDYAALDEILGKFVPREVVGKLVENLGRLGTVKESTRAACVMTDVEGYTALSTRFAASQIDALLSDYFALLFEPVARLGGFVSDLKGDSILAIWVDRTSQSGVRERVCDACLALLGAVERFNAQHPDTPMPTRIGVNYGEVTLGTMGASFHFEYRAVGDTVNTASRVEQLNKDLGTRLLVTAALIEGLDAFLVRDLGSFQLRGRRAPTRIYELVARADQARPEQRALCAAFTEALGAYERGQADAARAGFEALVAAHGDGPSAYYLRLLEA